MKHNVYSILKARFLINEDANATKNWRFIVFLIILAIIMIGNTQRFEQKVFKIIELNNDVKELRSEFVDRRSQLMKLKMESTISAEMESRNILPAAVPPTKIKVLAEPEKSFFKK
ncbi:MAG: S-adenosyl-methyltransferase, partial [Flavobacterium sp.]|nr:S-adenosyl-methyltransferase [Flavobacterium sp.]